jgi:hypothetical protein
MTRRDAAYLLALNALVSMAMLAAGEHWVFGSQKTAFAVLDVAELYRVKESQVAAVLVNHNATESERAAAVTGAASFATELTALIEALPEECRCLVLARGAVIGAIAPLPDLTPDVRRRLGL